MSDAPVLFDTVAAGGGKSVGIVTLNSPKTLNSLNREMVELMLDQMNRWSEDDSIACLFVHGSGEKALCAGGDVQALRQSAVDNPGGPCTYAEEFFEREYRLDHLFHTYPKPVVCWGHGVVMGGGLGIFAGASHRVVTEKSRFAMPEITIGLFPDVGGGYFLNRTPDGTGRFLALTAANFNGADALFMGLANHFVNHELMDDVIAGLADIEWGDDAHGQVDELMAGFDRRCQSHRPDGQVEKHTDSIERLCGDKPLPEVVAAISSLDTDDAWLAKARDALVHGSPLSVALTDRHLKECADRSLEDVFRADLTLAVNIVRFPEFAEGVRALLVDKDKNPQWRYSSVEDIPQEKLDSFFAPPWETHPLADL